MSQRNVGYWPLLRHNPEFTRLWIGQLVSNLGDWFNTVAVLALVYDLTQSGLSTGLIIIASTLPAFLLTPQVCSCARRFAVFPQNEPVGMVFHDIGQLVWAVVKNVLTASVLGNQWNPPKRDLDTFIVKRFDNPL